MKKLYTLLLSASLAASAAQAETLSVFGDATGTSTYLPLNIYYCSNNIHTQMIYPASELESLKGKVIEKLTFTVTRVGASVWNSSQVNVKMGTTSQSVYSGTSYIEEGLVDAATVKNISWATSLTAPFTWEITLDNPFTYTGDNLVLDFTNVKGTGPRNWTFKGATQTTVTSLSMTGSARQEKFLPTMDIEYSEAAGSSASLSAGDVTFPMQFVGNAATTMLRVTNTGTSELSGKVESTDAAFSVSPSVIEALAAGESAELSVTFDPTEAGNFTGALNVELGEAGMLTVNLSGMAVDGPADVRVLFNEQGYQTTLPAGWTGLAIETFTANGELSDMTTDYGAFGSNYQFESARVANQSCLLWNHANPVSFSDVYTRAYYILSPVVGGDFTLGGILCDSPATGAYIKAYVATRDAETGEYTLGEELPLTWDRELSQDAWSTATGSAPSLTYVAFQLKYAGVGYFASEANTDGISNVACEADNNRVEYYTIQGLRVNAPTAPGLYIRRTSTGATKILVR